MNSTLKLLMSIELIMGVNKMLNNIKLKLLTRFASFTTDTNTWFYFHFFQQNIGVYIEFEQNIGLCMTAVRV